MTLTLQGLYSPSSLLLHWAHCIAVDYIRLQFIHHHVLLRAGVTNITKMIKWGVPIVMQWKRTQLVSMKMRVRSMASLSRLRIWHCCELWYRLAAAALIRPTAWELPNATGSALKKKKKKKKDKMSHSCHVRASLLCQESSKALPTTTIACLSLHPQRSLQLLAKCKCAQDIFVESVTECSASGSKSKEKAAHFAPNKHICSLG